MLQDKKQIIQDIVGSIRRLIRAVSIDSVKMSRKFSLTAPQSGVMRSLNARGPISSADLSRELCVTPSNITGIIDRLEKKGLVSRIRREDDRRVVLIRLTENGASLAEGLPDPIETRLISALSGLKPAKVRELRDALSTVLHLIDAEHLEDEPLR
jgi:DNA-binding MarR family transcriptional regulator